MNLMKVPEAAERLGVTPKTIYNWISKGKLKAQRVGGRNIRIDELDLYEIIRPY